jgi:hypothetical protein
MLRAVLAGGILAISAFAAAAALADDEATTSDGPECVAEIGCP